MSRSRRRGYSLVELVVVVTIILVLTAMIVPVARFNWTRMKEMELKEALRNMRTAIDDYKRLSDQGLIPVEVGTEGYPKELEDLVKGMDLGLAKEVKVKFLRRIPKDPLTGKDEWGIRGSHQDPDEDMWDGSNVFDVYSKAEGKALDGSLYKEW